MKRNEFCALLLAAQSNMGLGGGKKCLGWYGKGESVDDGMNATSDTNAVGEYKYRVFLLGFLFVVPIEFFLKYVLSDGAIRWNTSVENSLVPIVVAYACEHFVQIRFPVKLRWKGSEKRHIGAFFVGVVVWAGALWLALPGIFESEKPFRFFINMAITYMFSGAFFEITNLLKVKLIYETW